MCGIAGTFGRNLPDKAATQDALKRMDHRGPNATGTYTDTLHRNRVRLLHTRLSIIDQNKRANQPFICDSLALVFNGEIYNYRELRGTLNKLGVRFKTESDTEVLLESYKMWGTACVDRFEGMWAFAIYNESRNQLFLSRDPFGEKPLFYTIRNGTFYFASEPKIFDALCGESLSVNTDKIRTYLVNGFRSLFKDNQTFFQGVFELNPGTYASITEPNTIKQYAYWKPSYNPVAISREDAVEGVQERLEQAVSLRLRADVPLAFCLSGGIDSTSLATIAAKRLNHKVHAFSVIDRDPRYDESENINTVVNNLNCEHFSIQTTVDGFFPRMEQLVRFHDAPVPTISYYVHSFLSEKIANQGYKVVLSGTGADEIFTGYYDHYLFWLAAQASSDRETNFLAEWRESYGAWVNNPLLKDPMAFAKNPKKRDHLYQNRDFFNRFMLEPVEEVFTEINFTEDLLRQRMLNELCVEIVPTILRADDANSMRWSIENRAPYLDKKLVEFLYSIPSEMLIHKGYPKWFLREAVAGLLPDSVRLDTRKRGFNASIDSVLDRSDKNTRDRLLSDSPIYDIIRRDKIETFLSTNMSDNSFAKFMFSFVSAKLFLDSRPSA